MRVNWHARTPNPVMSTCRVSMCGSVSVADGVGAIMGGLEGVDARMLASDSDR